MRPMDQTPGSYGSNRIRHQHPKGRHQECGSVHVAHLRQTMPRADIQQIQPHPGSHAAQRSQRYLRQSPGTKRDQQAQEHSMKNIRKTCSPATSYIRDAAGRDPNAHRRAKDTSRQVRNAVSAELGIGIGTF